MKRGFGLKRAVQPVARDALETMPTGALLARLQRLRWCEDTAAWSDLLPEEIASAGGTILFKEDSAWRAAHDDVKAVLVTRERRPNKPR